MFGLVHSISIRTVERLGADVATVRPPAQMVVNVRLQLFHAAQVFATDVADVRPVQFVQRVLVPTTVADRGELPGAVATWIRAVHL